MPKKYLNDLEALEVINQRITICEGFWSGYIDDWLEIYAAYRFYTDVPAEVARGEKANIFVPYIFAQIETKLPRIIQAVLGFNPFFEAVGVGEEDTPRAKNIQKLLQHQIYNEMDIFLPLVMWLKECLFYGNAFAALPWKKLEKKLRRNVPRYVGQEIVGYDSKPQMVTKYDGPVLQPLDIFDCLPAPFGTTIEDMPYFIIRSEPTAPYLKEMMEKGVYRKDATKKILEKMRGAGQLDKNRRDRLEYAGLEVTFGEDKKVPRYEMFTMWEDDWVVTKIDNEILRNEPTPFSEEEKPILMAINTPIPHELFAFGDVRPMLKMNYYANDIWNLNADNFFGLVNPGLLVSRDLKLDTARFEDKPHGLHLVDGLPQEGMFPVPRGSAQMDTMNQIGLIERFMNITSGSGDVMRGLSAQKGNQTLGEIMTLVDQANARFYLNIQLIKEFTLRRFLKMMVWRDQDFMPWKKMVRIMEGDQPTFPIFTPEDIMGNFDIEMKISPVQGNKLAWAQNLMMFVDLLNKNQGQNPELVGMIGQALGLDGAEKYVQNPAREAAMIIAQAMQEGLVKNAKQAFTVLLAVLQKLAPPGSSTAAAIGAKLPPTNVEGVARQEGQKIAGQGAGQPTGIPKKGEALG